MSPSARLRIGVGREVRAADWSRRWGQETVSGVGRVRIQARGLDGARTELTPRPSKIHKWTEASDGTGLESETLLKG